jgi:hypothetical protein
MASVDGHDGVSVLQLKALSGVIKTLSKRLQVTHRRPFAPSAHDIHNLPTRGIPTSHALTYCMRTHDPFIYTHSTHHTSHSPRHITPIL